MESIISLDQPVLLRERYLEVLEKIYLSRFTDEKMVKLAKQNKGGTFQLSILGHELVGVGCALELTPGVDWALPYYRDRAFAIGLGASLTDLIGAFLCRTVSHHSGGRMMPDHFSQKNLCIPCQSSVVGSQFLQAVGVAKGLKLLHNEAVVYVSAGEGATSQGDFLEALNFACLHKLGVIFVIQDNGWAISVPRSEQTAGGSILENVQSFSNLSVFAINGCDYEEIQRAMQTAVQKGRKGLGPSLIVADIVRLGPHSSSDDPSKYKDLNLVQKEKERDPVFIFEKDILRKELITQSEIEEIKKKCFQMVEEAAELAESYPFPEKKTVLDHVFKPVSEEEILLEKDAEPIVMVDALNHALQEEMQEDPGVIVFGQDVAHGKGGVFGVTRHLTAKFGHDRCFNTPLAESTIIALALGISLNGTHKPVAEIQFADYLWTGINQLFNELSSYHYRSNGEWNCPVVIRMPYGGYIQGGPYHSQSIEAFLAHCPGLKVVIPSNASDAKRLLKAAIRDPNPVIFLEHKALYRQRVFCARKEPSADSVLPLGKAHITHEGTDVTLVVWGMLAFMAHGIAEKLSKEGISIEVIDIRTIVPLDFETILNSVKKTSKVCIAHEAPLFCGFGAEIAAKLAEQAFAFLDAPIKRIGGLNCCVPYSKDLEESVLPQPADLEKAIKELASY